MLQFLTASNRAINLRVIKFEGVELYACSILFELEIKKQ
jgi:hypothetical protein